MLLLKEKQIFPLSLPPSLPIHLSVICLFLQPLLIIKVKQCSRPNVEIIEQCSQFSTFPSVDKSVGYTESLNPHADFKLLE